eukprot:Rmarinus@m.19928
MRKHREMIPRREDPSVMTQSRKRPLCELLGERSTHCARPCAITTRKRNNSAVGSRRSKRIKRKYWRTFLLGSQARIDGSCWNSLQRTTCWNYKCLSFSCTSASETR